MAVSLTIASKSTYSNSINDKISRSLTINDKAGIMNISMTSTNKTTAITAKNDFDLSTVGTDSIEPLTDHNSLAILDNISNFIRK